MALFRYVIIFSPNAFGQCNEGDTTLLSIEINETSQSGIEALRLADNPCAFLNTNGLEAGPAGMSVNVVINAQIDTAAVGNRNFRFFMCSGGRQYDGPSESPNSGPNGEITLKATYTVGKKVPNGDCAAFLRSKLKDETGPVGVAPSANSALPSPAEEITLSVKEQTKRIIKQILSR